MLRKLLTKRRLRKKPQLQLSKYVFKKSRKRKKRLNKHDFRKLRKRKKRLKLKEKWRKRRKGLGRRLKLRRKPPSYRLRKMPRRLHKLLSK